MKKLFTLFLIPVLALAINVNDIKVSQATKANPPSYVDRIFSPANSGLWGFDSSGMPVGIILGSNLSLSGNTLNASTTGAIAWGSITGTLSNQTDLITALNAKQATGNYITSLTGAGSLSGFSGGSATLTLSATGVVAGSYTNANFTIGADGRISLASNGGGGGGGGDFSTNTTTSVVNEIVLFSDTGGKTGKRSNGIGTGLPYLTAGVLGLAATTGTGSTAVLSVSPALTGTPAIAAATGASLALTGEITGKSTATGSVTSRTLADRFAYVINVLDYGAVGDGSTNCNGGIAAAFTKAKALFTLNSLPVAVFFPAGKYLVNATLTLNNADGISIIGQGMNASQLIRTTDYGDTLVVVGSYLAPTNIQGMGIVATNTVTSGANLVVQQVANSVISDIYLEGGFGGLKLQGDTSDIFDRIVIYGGSNVTGTPASGSYFVSVPTNGSPANPTQDILFNNFLFRFSGATPKKIETGIDIQQCDGVWFSNGHVIGANILMHIEPPSTYQAQNIQCVNFFLDGGPCAVCLQITGAGTVAGVRFGSNSIFAGCTGTGAADAVTVNCTLLRGLSFRGCEWGSNDDAALTLIAGDSIDVTDCKFADNNLASVANVVSVNSGASRVNIKGCSFGYQPAPQYAVLIAGPSYLTVSENDFKQVAGTDDIGISSLGSSCLVIRNTTDRSLSTVAAATPALPLCGDIFPITGNTTITTIPNLGPRRTITLQFSGTPTVTNGTNLKLAGGVDFNATADDTLTLATTNGVTWREVARSVN